MAPESKTVERREETAAFRGPAVPSRTLFFVVVALTAAICLSSAAAVAFGFSSLSSGQIWVLLLFLSIFAILGTSAALWLLQRHSREIAAAGSDGSIQWRTTSPEKQKRRLNVEVFDLGRLLGVEKSQLADLRAAYIVAEDLALRRVQNESGKPLMRKVSMGAADFDAVLIDRGLVTCISVVFLVRPTLEQEKVNRLLREAAIARDVIEEIREGSRVRLLLLLVTQLDRNDETKLRSGIVEYFRSTPVDVDIKWMDFMELQKLYSDE